MNRAEAVRQNMESDVHNLADMAAVSDIMMERFHDELRAVSDMEVTGRQAVTSLTDAANLVSFCTLQVKLMSEAVVDRYYRDGEPAA